MKILIKVIVGVVVLGVVLIGAAAVILPMVIDPDDVKERITSGVKEQTGRDLVITGDIGLSVFPWLGLDMGKVTLSNAPGFSEPVFASVDKVSVRVKLMPLLSKQIEMDTVIVHGLALNLEKDKRGNTNWDDLAGASDQPAQSAPSSSASPVAALAIGGLDIRDANMSWNDAQAGQSYKANNVSITTGEVSLGQPVSFDMNLDFAGSNPPISGHLSVVAELAVTGETKQARLNGLEVKADMTGEQLPGGKAQLVFSGNAAFDGVRQTLSVSALDLKAMDLHVTGELSAKDIDKGAQFSGKISVAEFNPKSLLKALGQTPPQTSDPEALTKVSLQTTLSGNADALEVKPLTIALDQSTLQGNLSISHFAKPAVRFELNLDTIDADRYLPPKPAGEESAATPGTAAAGAGELPMQMLRDLDIDGRFNAGKVKVAKLNITEIVTRLRAKGGLISVNPAAAKLYNGTYQGNIGLDARTDVLRTSVDEKLTAVQTGPLLKDLLGEQRLSGLANVTINLKTAGADAQAAKQALNGKVSFAFTDGAVSGVDIGGMIREAKAKIGGKTLPASDQPKKTDFSELTGTIDFVNGLGTNNDLSAKSPLLRITGKGNADLPSEKLDYRLTALLVATSKGQGGDDLADLAGVPIPVRITGSFQEPAYGLDFKALAGAIAKSKAGNLVTEQSGKVVESITGQAGGAAGEAVEKAGGVLKGLFGQ